MSKTESAAAETHDGDALARRNALTLSVAQALGGANPSIVVSLGGIVGYALAVDKTLSTLPVSLMQLGLASGVIPAAYVMRHYGRRLGYMFGGFLGVIAGAVAALGTAQSSFWLFCFGAFIAGWYAAYVQSYRFAAVDTGSEHFKPRAISWVMLGGLVAAVIGPQSVNLTRDLTPATPFAASFLTQALLAFVAIGVVATLKPAPMPPESKGGGRPLGEIMKQPRFIAAVIAALVSYALMSFMMTAAPLAMVGCGHDIGDATNGISLHIIAMFAPSFFTGRLISRFGKVAVTVTGLALMAAAAITGLSGLAVANFWIALILLGVGWNFSFIGATSLVTECYRPEERVKVQAANDFLVFGSTAIASFSSGQLLTLSGWNTLNLLMFPPLAIALVLVLWQGWRSSQVRTKT